MWLVSGEDEAKASDDTNMCKEMAKSSKLRRGVWWGNNDKFQAWWYFLLLYARRNRINITAGAAFTGKLTYTIFIPFISVCVCVCFSLFWPYILFVGIAINSFYSCIIFSSLPHTCDAIHIQTMYLKLAPLFGRWWWFSICLSLHTADPSTHRIQSVVADFIATNKKYHKIEEFPCIWHICFESLTTTQCSQTHLLCMYLP